MKEHLNKLEEKIIFYKVVKRLVYAFITLLISASIFIGLNTLKITDDWYDIKENEYLNIKTITDGVLNIRYKSKNIEDRAVIFITKDVGTKYKYILEPNKDYIITLTEGIGKYVIENYSVCGESVLLGENIELKLNKTPEYIYKIPTSDIDFRDSYNKIEEQFGNINDIEEIAINISNFDYDSTFAYNVKNGNIQIYSPDISRFLDERVGVCIDAATTLTAIYRFKGYDAQLVYGYKEGSNEYHSWVRVYHNDEWVTFDPTLCKNGKVEDDSKYLISEYH